MNEKPIPTGQAMSMLPCWSSEAFWPLLGRLLKVRFGCLDSAELPVSKRPHCGL